jgi:hypothetical protein
VPELSRFLGIVVYMLYDDIARHTSTRSTASTRLPSRSTRGSFREDLPVVL